MLSSSLSHRCASHKRVSNRNLARHPVARKAFGRKKHTVPHGQWPSADELRLEAPLRAYFRRLGWRLEKDLEDARKGVFLVERGIMKGIWWVTVPEDDGFSPASINFKSLIDLHKHWEWVGKRWVDYDNRERIFKRLYLTLDEDFRSALRRWAEVGGKLPAPAQQAERNFQEQSCSMNWSERVVQLDSPRLMPSSGLGEWDDLRHRLLEFIVSKDKEALARSLPLPVERSESAKRL